MRLARLSFVALTLALGTKSFAWAPQTRVELVDRAIQFMPPALRLAMEQHREEIRRGMLEPLLDEDSTAHRPLQSGGSLETSIVRAADGIVSAVAKPERFSELCRRFGELAHYVADAGFPPGTAGPEASFRYHNFGEFIESRKAKFPLVFYGLADPDLAKHDFAAFAARSVSRSRHEDGNLARAYLAAGMPPDPAAFDDRSIPFAVGSLSLSRTVTGIVRAWLAAWEQAGGDLGRTPYVQQSQRPGGPSILTPPAADADHVAGSP